MNISAEQVFLRWRPALRQTGGLKTQPCTAQVRQYLLDHQRIFDASDDVHAAAADTTRFDVDIEHPLQALRPAHWCLACNRAGSCWTRCCGLMTAATPGQRHQCSVLTVGCEHAVIALEIQPRFRHQRRQPGDEIQGVLVRYTRQGWGLPKA